MTRRITLAILMTLCAMIVVAGLTAYFATRVVLLHELDARLVARAAALPEVSGLPGTSPDPDDRYLIQHEHGRVVRRDGERAPSTPAKVLSAGFADLADGRHFRSVTVEFTKPDGGSVTVVYSGPADAFDRVLARLVIALSAFAVIGGVSAVAVAAAASRAALRPLNDVAEVVGAIDEQNLARRIDADRLPDELKPIGRRLNDMLHRLEESFFQRRQFIADASHELRTPVAALLTTLEVCLARRQPDVDRQRRALEDCLTDARMLRRLVERLTSQVRGEAESGQAQQDIDLRALLAECVVVGKGFALTNQVTVESSCPEPLRVRTEPERLRRVLINLLGNAVAYNIPGGRVTVECEPDAVDVTIRVRDTGIGIPEEHLPHVFSLFYRADPSRTSAAGHSGLGLYQVQSDVRALNGRCSIESEVGVGTCVTVRLNQCVVASEGAGPTVTRTESAELSRIS